MRINEQEIRYHLIDLILRKKGDDNNQMAGMQNTSS
ncbi:hypothetical protein CLV98_104162 [Dyadobacter jejuensis]|uniref:Uncharacterized protein n=1 Tax=Dyadobacter jejuensis TaxID=1082580 RepID=A0A316AKK7_9BACT|nr:hypothetical protein CLV98_104162 [Dyadobacter jejuensis]